MNPPSFLAASCYVAAGGAVGSWLRYLVARACPPVLGGFPWATLTVNVAGSFAMGLLAGWLARFGGLGGEAWRLLLGAYLFGAVMTFELQAKAAGINIVAPEFLAALPYLATIVVLALISSRRSVGAAAPACLGRPFKPAT